MSEDSGEVRIHSFVSRWVLGIFGDRLGSLHISSQFRGYTKTATIGGYSVLTRSSSDWAIIQVMMLLMILR